jgi:hypothetical protein
MIFRHTNLVLLLCAVQSALFAQELATLGRPVMALMAAAVAVLLLFLASEIEEVQ